MSAILISLMMLYAFLFIIIIMSMKEKPKKVEKKEDKPKDTMKEDYKFLLDQMNNLTDKLSLVIEENDKIKKELIEKNILNEKLETKIKNKTFTKEDEEFINEQTKVINDLKERFKAYDEMTKNGIEEEEEKVDEVELEKAKFNTYMARMEMIKFRNSLSIENIEKNMNIVIGRIIDQFFLANYYNNPNFVNSDGTYTPPFINEQRRRIDMFAIYAQFRTEISDDFLEELALIYKYDAVSSESFIIRRYIAPYYNKNLSNYKKAYREYLRRESEAYIKRMEERKLNPFWNSDFTDEQTAILEKMNEIAPIDEKKEAIREYLHDLKRRNGTLNR